MCASRPCGMGLYLCVEWGLQIAVEMGAHQLVEIGELVLSTTEEGRGCSMGRITRADCKIVKGCWGLCSVGIEGQR